QFVVASTNQTGVAGFSFVAFCSSFSCSFVLHFSVSEQRIGISFWSIERYHCMAFRLVSLPTFCPTCCCVVLLLCSRPKSEDVTVYIETTTRPHRHLAVHVDGG